jgi:hypothetical protein
MAEFWLYPGSSAEISLILPTGNLCVTSRDLLAGWLTVRLGCKECPGTSGRCGCNAQYPECP